jgi:acetolactate synthase small subunit
MEWMFLITACNRTRVESRILQVLDHHMISAQSFASMQAGNEIRVSFMADIDRANAIRTSDLLRKLPDVQFVDSFASHDGLCRTLALFKVLCDQESRLPLLQIISSLGAQVVSIRPEWVAFQIIGTMQDIEGLRESLLPYGLVEAISVASAVVRKEPATEAVKELPATLTVIPELIRRPRKERTAALV